MKLLSRRKTKQTSAEAFWSWFAANKIRVENIFSDPTVFDELMEMAQRFSKRIEFLVGKPNDTFQLYVSCNGIKEGIPAVKELVAAAPKLAGWDIIAFKQPLPTKEFESEEGVVTYQGTYSVDAVTASFALTKDGDLYHLTIFSPENRMEAGHKFAYYLLLDMLLGEYYVMTRLGDIEMVPKNDTANRPSLVKLKDYLPV